jgi:hypothetical protein
MPLLQAELLLRLQSALPPSTTDLGQLLLLNDVRSSFAFDSSGVNAATGTLTIAAHDFSDTGSGTRVQFPSAAPGGLTLNLDYWVRNVSGTSFQISATPGGTPIGVFSSAGSGTMTIGDQPLSAIDQSLTTPASNTVQWVRKEIAYQGASRLSVSTPTASSYTIAVVAGVFRAKVALLAPIDNSAGSAGITFNKILLLTGGSLSAGNTTGTPNRWWDVAGSLAAGASLSYILNSFESN